MTGGANSQCWVNTTVPHLTDATSPVTNMNITEDFFPHNIYNPCVWSLLYLVAAVLSGVRVTGGVLSKLSVLGQYHCTTLNCPLNNSLCTLTTPTPTPCTVPRTIYVLPQPIQLTRYISFHGEGVVVQDSEFTPSNP